MCVSVQSVRDVSVTGEFDDIADGKISAAIELHCPLYAAIQAKNIGRWRELVRLHVAHYLHVALQQEGSGGGGGPVSSESFAQVGSRSYAVAVQQPDGSNWWQSSPYGQSWHRFWLALPTALRAV